MRVNDRRDPARQNRDGLNHHHQSRKGCNPGIGQKIRRKIEITLRQIPPKKRKSRTNSRVQLSSVQHNQRQNFRPLHQDRISASFNNFDRATHSSRTETYEPQFSAGQDIKRSTDQWPKLRTGFGFVRRIKQPFFRDAQETAGTTENYAGYDRSYREEPGLQAYAENYAESEIYSEMYPEGFWDSLADFSLLLWQRLRLDGLLFALQIAIFSLLLQQYLPPLSRYYFSQTATTLLREAEDDLDKLLGEDLLAEQSSRRAFPGNNNAGAIEQVRIASIGGGQARPSLNTEATQLENKTSTGAKGRDDPAAKSLAVLYPAYETREYTVQSGESISLLTRRFRLNMSTLISVNGIERAKSLRAGQKIQIPNIDGLLYRIQPKDTLISIAERQQSSIGALIDTNQLESETLIAGEQIFIPGATLSSYELRKVFGNLYIYPYFEFLKKSRKVRLSSRFGYRSNPFRKGYREFHNGIDIPGPYGSPVQASSDGTVATSGQNYIYGKYIILQHKKGIKTLYGHMSRLLVRKGQKVIQGQSIGWIGSSGRSTGPHVHFSIFVGGKAVNPLDYLSTP